MTRPPGDGPGSPETAEPGTPDAEGAAPPPTGPGAALVGRILAGRYRILRLLGEGAMGSVYLGEHLKIGRRDAIKVLRSSMARDDEAVARFTRGARNASLVRHPHVCAIYDFGETEEGLAFLAMEFVSGESLTDVLARAGPLPPERAAGIALQIADALQAAHEMDVVHRDLKPDNVMVTPGRSGGDVVKVVDFDIAKGSRDGEDREVTRLGFVIGTPEYMSPEQLTGDPLDGRSDIYSLGMVLFRMLAGDFPFRAESTQEMMVKRLTEDPLSLADVRPDRVFPEGLQAVVDRALARRPGERHESAAAFASALRDAVFGREAGREGAGAGVSGSPRPGGPVRATLEVPAAGPAGVGAGETVPPTRVSAPAVAEDGRPRRGWVRIGAAAGVVLTVAAGVALLRGGDPEAATVEILPARVAMAPGSTTRLSARTLDPSGTVVDAEVEWSSSDPSVASVDGDGTVTGRGAGSAMVLAEAGSARGAVEVTVRAPFRIEVGEAELGFGGRVGGAPPAVREVPVAGPDGPVEGLAVEAVYGAGARSDWLDVGLSGAATPATLTVRPRTRGLPAGRHVATVRVSSGDVAREIPVVLVLAPAETAEGGGGGDRGEAPALTAVAADSLLARQLASGLGRSPASARAVADSARLVLGAAGLPDATRARAAFTLGLSLDELGDRPEALRWLREAVRLDPASETYRNLLRALEGGGG